MLNKNRSFQILEFISPREYKSPGDKRSELDLKRDFRLRLTSCPIDMPVSGAVPIGWLLGPLRLSQRVLKCCSGIV